jgi:hypothetical protein
MDAAALKMETVHPAAILGRSFMGMLIARTRRNWRDIAWSTYE